MKNNFRQSGLGVTLLEIMLVLAVAAMIIVMSVRYYQSATASQQANTVLSQIQVIIASADSLSQASGTYVGNATDANVTPLVRNSGGLSTPWGGTIALTGQSATAFTMTLSTVPNDVCGLIAARLKGDTHFSITQDCGGGTGTSSQLVFSYSRVGGSVTP